MEYPSVSRFSSSESYFKICDRQIGSFKIRSRLLKKGAEIVISRRGFSAGQLGGMYHNITGADYRRGSFGYFLGNGAGGFLSKLFHGDIG